MGEEKSWSYTCADNIIIIFLLVGTIYLTHFYCKFVGYLQLSAELFARGKNSPPKNLYLISLLERKQECAHVGTIC